jgi:hypothetical protein
VDGEVQFNIKQRSSILWLWSLPRFQIIISSPQAFSQKGVQASWDALEQNMDAFGRPKSGGKGKLFSIISPSILIYLKRNSFNSHYYDTFDILINLMVYLAEWNSVLTKSSVFEKFRMSLEQILIWSNVNFKGFPEEPFLDPPPPPPPPPPPSSLL